MTIEDRDRVFEENYFKYDDDIEGWIGWGRWRRNDGYEHTYLFARKWGNMGNFSICCTHPDKVEYLFDNDEIVTFNLIDENQLNVILKSLVVVE